MRLKSGRMAEWQVSRAGQAEWCRGHRHSPDRSATDSGDRIHGWSAGTARATDNHWSGNSHAALDLDRSRRDVLSFVSVGLPETNLLNGSVVAFRVFGCQTVRHFEVHVTDSDDQHDRSPTFGFGDRIDAWIKLRRNERLDTGDGQFLVPRIGQVDDLRYEVVALDLIEVLVGDLERHAVVRQVGIRCRMSRVHLQGRVKDQAFSPRDVRQLQPEGRSLREVVPRRRKQLVLGVARTSVPSDVHPVRTDEANLRRLSLEGSRWRWSQHRHHTGARSVDHGSRMRQLLSWRSHVLVVVHHLLPVHLAADADDQKRPEGQKIESHP